MGASSVAANLAAAYTVLGHKVLLVDLDPKNCVDLGLVIQLSMFLAGLTLLSIKRAGKAR
ncbi:hypothetical protein JCM19239_3608 [Vibrio variabilis]|uniref:Flagellar synthesis regulator FleN n=1 Tax=Vibrio variabilis TaxID=990271 RepID=A0ABQ0JBY2_9VIBR|nr:hypothetical protein JCM19239_3608 [Vibrio variabilis]